MRKIMVNDPYSPNTKDGPKVVALSILSSLVELHFFFPVSNKLSRDVQQWLLMRLCNLFTVFFGRT